MEHQTPKVEVRPLAQRQVQSLQEWLRQPAARDFRRLIASKLTVATIEAGQKLADAIEDPADMALAQQAAAQAHQLEGFLQLLDSATSGKDGSSESAAFEYFDVVVTIPKTQNEPT